MPPIAEKNRVTEIMKPAAPRLSSHSFMIVGIANA